MIHVPNEVERGFLVGHFVLRVLGLAQFSNKKKMNPHSPQKIHYVQLLACPNNVVRVQSKKK